MTFEPGKEYKTELGDLAIVDAVDIDENGTICGRIYRGGDRRNWVLMSWNKNGGMRGTKMRDSDSLMPPEPEKITRWVVVFGDRGGYAALYEDKERIRDLSGMDVVAIVPITFRRGEGLE